MNICFSPVRLDQPLPNVVYSKDALTIDGKLFDFRLLPDGATLPASAIDSEWFADRIERVDGEITLTLMLPHGPNPSQAVAFPEPIRVTKAGAVKLPFDAPESAEENAHVD